MVLEAVNTAERCANKRIEEHRKPNKNPSPETLLMVGTLALSATHTDTRENSYNFH